MDEMPSTDRGSLDGSRDTLVELDARESSNFEITLFWDRARDRVRVLVVNRLTDGVSTVEASPERALEVFWHPFQYLTEGA